MGERFRTVTDVLEYRAGELNGAAVYIFRDGQLRHTALTWADLYKLAGRFAAVLRQGGLQDDDAGGGNTTKGVCGVGRGDLVVNTLPNSPERAVCEASIMLSGAASVHGMCQMKDGSDLLRTLRVSRATAILLDPDVIDSPWNVLSHHVTLRSDGNVVSSSSLPDLKKVYMVRRVEGRGPGDFLATLESRRSCFKAEDITPDDVLIVLPTSGSTGFSKLVVFCHKTFTRVCQDQGVWTEMFGGKATLAEFNMASMGWGGGNIHSLIVSGNTRVAIDIRAGGLPENVTEVIWRSIQDTRCDRAYLSPKFLAEMAQLAGEDPSAHRMKTMLLGGMPLTREMVKNSLAFADEVLLDYAATDFGLVSGMHVTDWRSYVDHDTGPPSDGVKVKIVSQDNENLELPVNQTGSILVQHDNMPQGYLNDPQATADLFTKDGWIRTGDVGRLDERGHLVVEGRGSDAIMRGPYIYYPIWLEDLIRACPLVRDVLVVGVPDPDLYEEICACVVLQSGEGSDEEGEALKEVRQFVEQEITVSEKDITSSRPHFYLQFSSLPASATDKPRRRELKKMAAERLGLA